MASNGGSIHARGRAAAAVGSEVGCASATLEAEQASVSLPYWEADLSRRAVLVWQVARLWSQPSVVLSVCNFRSTNDGVLRFLYKFAEGGRKAAGLGGFEASNDKLKNIDASNVVDGHWHCHGNVELV